MDTISIVLAADNNYAQHIAVAAASILTHTDEPERVHLFVLADGIVPNKKTAIEDTVKKWNAQLTFIDVDGDSIKGFTSDHISKAAYLRLMIAELLPDAVEKAIYFDTDLVVLDDVKDLWITDLQGKPVGAVPDLGIMSSKRSMSDKMQTLGLGDGDMYFNSGMLLIDVSAWRRDGWGHKVLECIGAHNFRHHDQDGLNLIFKNNWYHLPVRWNVIPPVFSLPLKILTNSKFRSMAVEALKNPAVFHWAGRYKPWEFAKGSIFNAYYYENLAQTAFADVAMPQPSKHMEDKSITRQEWRMKWAKFWTGVF